jgi:hypothetical protein
MVASANEDIFGLPSYRKYGFVRAEDESESVSKTLEYSYDDWCIAQMANEMGEDSLADVFYKRSESWRNIINPETGFATPRLNGDWLPNFDPKEVNLHFTEANSWQYSFVQHEAGMMGSSEDLEKRLDALFSEKEQTTGRTQSDITGLIGQYAHGNEPSHHIAYLYNYTVHPEKGQKIIKQICDSFYTNTPDGLIGNEDCGQMSAWYVFSSMGFYPNCPGNRKYYAGTCAFDSVNINLEKDKVFQVKGNNEYDKVPAIKSEENFYVLLPYATSTSIINSGSTLSFVEASKVDSASHWGNEVWITEFVETPIIEGQSIFKDKTVITLKPVGNDNKVRYRFKEEENWIDYTNPFIIKNTTDVFAQVAKPALNYYVDDGGPVLNYSPTISATFYKKPNNWTCTPSIQPNSQYTGGGDDALIDGINGTANWQAGRWQGYQNEVVAFDLDFKEDKEIQEVQVGFLQDARSWILMPSKVEVYYEGKLIGTTSYTPDAFTEGNFLETIKVKLDRNTKTNKLQIKIYSAGKLPEGHQGHTMGGDAFFFVDELEIK